MPRFFVQASQICDTSVTLTGEDAHHIARSLRMAVGELLVVCDSLGTEYSCRIEAFDEDKVVTARILSSHSAEGEPPIRVRLFQALPKGDKLDLIIQKAVECGVAEVIPFESENCVVKRKPEVESRKTDRRNRIALEAAKQCRRSVVPNVLPTVSFDEMLNLASRSDLCLFCYEEEGTALLGQVLERTFSNRKPVYRMEISVVIGSEGGFSAKEAELAQKSGMISVGLGKRILRTETASCFVLSCLVCFTELM